MLHHDQQPRAFMDAQQALNLAIFERFEKDGIGFAHPTQAQVQRKA